MTPGPFLNRQKRHAKFELSNTVVHNIMRLHYEQWNRSVIDYWTSKEFETLGSNDTKITLQ